MTSVFTLLTPLAANASIGALIAVRLIEGIFEVNKSIEISIKNIFFNSCNWRHIRA
jgi:hypothetical protein